ncbi:snare associated Golgi protein-domain-containing protein [Gamsiella multidivaricata]|uniref:snare associated Golgi protein-domain-containing protein n=1 Tax=Gamsiella multidivaricata TaxID=101098 RepID=UPI0022206C44|nr:snare associated Golgi protein-domain-containing protein [Gamsiella multidivaricata]KAG0371110.1 hypothetical protein BGZ54_000054 [Gamsiella multidivaricata]KAI7822177.1 snare associated Golgi protein-domain-containing protein [Gamsiella multidivaricata]
MGKKKPSKKASRPKGPTPSVSASATLNSVADTPQNAHAATAAPIVDAQNQQVDVGIVIQQDDPAGTTYTDDTQNERRESHGRSSELLAQDLPQPQSDLARASDTSMDFVSSEAQVHPFSDNSGGVDRVQEEWPSLQPTRDPHSASRIARTPNEWSHNMDEQEIAAADDTDFSDQHPIEHAAPRRYEDDDDEDNHRDTEHSPLIQEGSHEGSGRSGDEGGQRVGQGWPGQKRTTQEQQQPTTWAEWAVQVGLHPRTWNRQTYIKAALLAVLLTLIILSFTVFHIQDHIKDVLRYIDKHKRIGAVLFILSYTVACTLFLPGSLFTVGAGFLFKPFPLALLIVLLGDIFAAIWSFIFGRYVFYDWVKSMMARHPKFNALDEVIKDDGWKIVVMLRLTPIPFNLITYFFSITSIRLFTVVWATCVGVLPGSCIGIWIGSLLKGLSGIDNPDLETKNVVILVMNGIFIVCCILTLSMFGKRSLRKAMKRLDQHQALTNLQEVEVVVEGVATVIRELEDTARIPPSLRSSFIERLAEEETEFNRDGGDLEFAQLLQPSHHIEGQTSRATSATLTNHRVDDNNKATEANLPPSSGFTRGEKITFVVITIVAVLNVCVCVPLYFHFANQGE